MSEESKAVRYAEKVLDVHGVYSLACAAQGKYENALTESADHHNHVRMLREVLEDAEVSLSIKHRADYPDLSVAAFERHMKVILQTDDECRDIRQRIVTHQYEADKAEMEAKGRKSEIEMYVARMQELGGLLNFYAATKTTTPIPTE